MKSKVKKRKGDCPILYIFFSLFILLNVLELDTTINPTKNMHDYPESKIKPEMKISSS